MNAAAALMAGNMAKSFSEGIEKASSAIESGAAIKKLKEIKDITSKL